LWVEAAIDRLREFSSLKATKSMALFRNHGREAGASLAHAHSQIVTTPVVPTRIEQEQRAMKKFHDLTGGCALCRIRASESRSDRKIWDTGNFTVFAPWASIYPFEFWVVPKRHTATILESSQDEIKDLAVTIRLSFGALAGVLSDPPYNSIFHLSSSNRAGSDFHWHLEVYPKLSIHAGFELGTGMYINTLKPEAAAEELAKAVEKEAANLENITEAD
jgi:UDPglucose--hexose-1-phosphate uridylyltransferase